MENKAKPTHVLIRNNDGTILESRGPEAAARLVSAMGESAERDTFMLRQPDAD